MSTAKIFMNGRSQAVRLPKEFRFDDDVASIRQEGEAVILEPIRKDSWPVAFFDEIRIADSKFARPEQPVTPPAPELSDS